MAHDEGLAARVRAALADVDGVAEKRMFGGLAFLVGGHMTVVVSGAGGLMVRVDPARTPELVGGAGVDRMVMRGKAMDGWLRVVAADGEPDDLDDDAVRGWVAEGLDYVDGLPAR